MNSLLFKFFIYNVIDVIIIISILFSFKCTLALTGINSIEVSSILLCDNSIAILIAFVITFRHSVLGFHFSKVIIPSLALSAICLAFSESNCRFVANWITSTAFHSSAFSCHTFHILINSWLNYWSNRVLAIMMIYRCYK